MTTTVQLSDEELADLKELTNQSDAAAAVRAAMQDYVRYARKTAIKTAVGPRPDTGQLAGIGSRRNRFAK